MKKLFLSGLILYWIAFLFILASCNSDTSNKQEVVEINITQAQENHKDFPLSKLVKDVKILELEAKEGCYIEMPHLWFVGKKHILIMDHRVMQLFLFDRSGKFIRKIGQAGKGPGEYNGMGLQGTMDKAEEHIILTNHSASLVIVYNLDGSVFSQTDLSSQFASNYILRINCPFENTIAFASHRPWGPYEGYSSVELFDLELNKLTGVLPRANDDKLACRNIQHVDLFSDGKTAYFREMFNDTVFQYSRNGTSQPRFRFTVEKNGLTTNQMYNKDWDLNIYDFTFPIFVYQLGDYLIADIAGKDDDVFHHIKTGETFSIGHSVSCRKNSDNPYRTMENDVFGLEPIRFHSQTSDHKYLVYTLEMEVIAEQHDLDCIRKLPVNNPAVRDQILDYIENPSEEQGILVLFLEIK